MKSLKLMFPLFLFAMIIFVFACGDRAAKGGADAKQEKEYTSAYICTMHCKGSGSDKSGTCPVCPMEYVVNENFKGTDTPNTQHEHDHDDHDHHDGHNH